MSGQYDFDLPIKLETAIDFYQQDRQHYWDSYLDGEGQEWSPLRDLLASADNIANLLAKRAAALRNIGDNKDLNDIHQLYLDAIERAEQQFGGDWPVFEERVRAALPRKQAEELLAGLRAGRVDPEDGRPGDPIPMRLAWEQLCINDAWDVVSTIGQRVRRTFQLERLVHELLGRKQPSGPCLRYLALVSRCYIYGFDAECVTMCRSAMDEAFRDCITDEQCHRVGRHGDITLADRIYAAQANSRLAGDVELFKAAEAVRIRGRKAVHGEPDAVEDVLGTVKSALRVIDALSKIQP